MAFNSSLADFICSFSLFLVLFVRAFFSSSLALFISSFSSPCLVFRFSIAVIFKGTLPIFWLAAPFCGAVFKVEFCAVLSAFFGVLPYSIQTPFVAKSSVLEFCVFGAVFGAVCVLEFGAVLEFCVFGAVFGSVLEFEPSLFAIFFAALFAILSLTHTKDGWTTAPIPAPSPTPFAKSLRFSL